MVENFRKLGCLMNLKLHFLDSHFDYFPEILGDYSEKQGERFHQDIKEMGRRYHGRWDVNMMADFCWTLKRSVPVRGKKQSQDFEWFFKVLQHLRPYRAFLTPDLDSASQNT
ncbi:hypothetical protein RF55_19128 [Lasius niger]|uniref:Uncharacterized protein n=1 Tax=Lasius niger TaxID=67767 RepID=A0A0J7K0C5_LASNI|nr:hypothetical protein RF55_19128 [Lasius niger]